MSLRSSTTLCRRLLLGLALATAVGASLGQEVEVAHGLHPNTSRWMTTENTSQQTLSVVEDRGLVASSLSRGIVFPVSVNMTQRQVIRLTAGDRSPDGSFPVSMEFVDQDSFVRDVQGREQRLPNATRLRGLVVNAVMAAPGSVRQDSVQLRGASEEDAKLLKPVLLAVFDQMKGMAPVRLRQGEPVAQDTKLSLPIANLATIDMVISTIYTLQRITEGVAEIDTKISMSFGQLQAPLRMTASGFGSGTMRYAVDARRIDHFETRSVTSFDVETPDGTLRIQSTSLNLLSTREVGPGRP